MRVNHLKFIQNNIGRLSHKSANCKNWALTLVCAILALELDQDINKKIIVILLPVFGFWVLSAYYLRQERLFRALYDDVRVQEDHNIDYSMDTTKFEKDVDCLLKTIVNKNLIYFYLPIIIVSIGMILGGDKI